jgi:hypothetical protein
VVLFNDEQRGVRHKYGNWWVEGLLKAINRNRFHEVLERNGYDGIIAYDPDDGRPTEYVAYRPEQIKLAEGNDGSFDADDPDVRSNSSRGRR